MYLTQKVCCISTILSEVNHENIMDIKNLPFTIHFHISFKWLPLGIAWQQISSNFLYFLQHPRKIVIPQCYLENLNITSDFRIFQFHFKISSEFVIMGTTFKQMFHSFYNALGIFLQLLMLLFVNFILWSTGESASTNTKNLIFLFSTSRTDLLA